MEEEEESIHEYPPGFRFYPTEEELVSFYLRHQLQTELPEKHRVIPLLNIYNFEPWDLPSTYLLEKKKKKDFHFVFLVHDVIVKILNFIHFLS